MSEQLQNQYTVQMDKELKYKKTKPTHGGTRDQFIAFVK